MTTVLNSYCIENWTILKQKEPILQTWKAWKTWKTTGKTTSEGRIFADMPNSPIITWSTLNISWQKLTQFNTQTWPDLCNTASWEALQKGHLPTDLENLEKLQKLHLGGPNFRQFLPTHTSNFQAFQGKLGQSNPKIWPDLHNTASWKALHKRTSTSDQYRQRNRRFTTPLSQWIQLNWLKPRKGTKNTKKEPNGLSNVRKIHTNLYFDH